MEKKCKKTIPLPHELILYEILPKLPIETLYRFKLVSKLWNSTISTDPSFIKAHFSYSSSSSTAPTLLITFRGINRVKMLVSTHIKPNNEAQIQARTFPQRVRSISQSLQSLNLIHYKNPSSLVITNTATRRITTLPLLKDDGKLHSVKISFGFDPLRNQHKVLATRVIHTDDPNETRKEDWVLTLTRPGLHWRQIPSVPTAHIPEPSCQSICINGFVYYVASLPDFDPDPFPPEEPKYIVVEFDVSNEKYDYISFPKCDISPKLINYSDGKLALVPNNYDATNVTSTNGMCFWILCEDEEKKKIWAAKELKIPIDVSTMTDWNFMVTGTIARTGELIIVEKVARVLYLYNIETKCVGRIAISKLLKDVEPKNYFVVDVCDHVKSVWFPDI